MAIDLDALKAELEAIGREADVITNYRGETRLNVRLYPGSSLLGWTVWETGLIEKPSTPFDWTAIDIIRKYVEPTGVVK